MNHKSPFGAFPGYRLDQLEEILEAGRGSKRLAAEVARRRSFSDQERRDMVRRELVRVSRKWLRDA